MEQVHAPAPWPHLLLDIDRLHREGWRPVPLREFVLKICQRCNLACDYCYVYRMADQTWRTRPPHMPEQVIAAAACRIGEYAASNDLSEITVVLHGGEPLLAGLERLSTIVETVRGAVPTTTRIRFATQTNGVLLTETLLRGLGDLDVHVGVSLDGSASQHDHHRRFRDGRGSSARVHQGLALLGSQPHRRLFSGILTTVDSTADPQRCFEALLAFDPPAVDLLLPHANWSMSQPRRGVREAPFGTWLARFFDRWYNAPVREARVPFLEEIIHMVLGGVGHSDCVGLSPAVMVVIETDGSIEQADSLKSAYHGAPTTGLSVFDDPLQSVFEHPGFVARQLGEAALPAQCRDCELLRVCGGGAYPHRYRHGHGFQNPSVYCADLGLLINHIQRRVLTDVRTRFGMIPR